jgi:Secretion system C-terminal sorting domain
MNIACCLQKCRYFFCMVSFCLSCIYSESQLCSNTLDTIYGLNTKGQIVGINTINGGGTAIGIPAVGDTNSNALGYNPANGLFYFFNKNGSKTQGQEFVSYNPLTSSLSILAPSPILPGYIVRSGTVDNTGNSYYTLDSSNTPVVHSNLYHYNIATNKWKKVTSQLVDPSFNPIPAIDTLISGDMAFDGSGNLWMLCASKWNYALYEIVAPVPKGPTGMLVVNTIIPVTKNPAIMSGNVSFAGIAFNSAGNLYLTSANTAGGNRLYKLTTSSAASLTLIGAIPADYGSDLATCTPPLFVLPVVWLNFTGTFRNNMIELSWKAKEYGNVSGYNVEHSTDGLHWQTIAKIGAGNSADGNEKAYNYKSDKYNSGSNYFRIVQTSLTGKGSMSDIKLVNTIDDNKITIGPNPLKDIIYIYKRTNTSKYMAQIYDLSGKLIYSTVINPNQQSIDISNVQKGAYFLKLISATNGQVTAYQFMKW